jgi:hypothetical protein
LKNLEEKKNQISAMFSTQTPPDDWPDAIDHFLFWLLINTQNLEKQVKI